MEHADRPVVATYREFIPRDELRGDVEAIFSFVPGAPAVDARVLRQVLFRTGHSFCAPRFADGSASIALELGMTCTADGVWRESDRVGGFVIGPMREVGPAVPAQCPLMVGAYLKPGRLAAFFGVTAAELTDTVVALDHLWRSSSALAAELTDLHEPERIARLERELLRRLSGRFDPRVSVDGITAFVCERRGQVSVQRLSDEAGVSRQHLTRVFREVVGLTPKLYCRLVRFHAGLAYAGCGSAVDWADVAQRLGYADQSHMIAEFKQFSSLTPRQLASRPWFHPFIERAKARRNAAIAARRPG
jgi:AraC-like DNA-binding protein